MLNNFNDLTETHDKCTVLFESAPIGYLVLNQRGIILKVNATLCNYLDYDCTELEQVPLVGFIHSDDQRRFLDIYSELFDDPTDKKIKLKHLKDWGLFFIVEPIKGKTKDVQGAFIMKVMHFIEKELKNNDFQIKDSNFDFEHIYLIVKKEKLSNYIIHMGPPKRQKKNCREFIAKHTGRKKVFEKDKRLCVRIKRKYAEPTHFVEKLLKEDYVKSRVKSIKMLKRLR